MKKRLGVFLATGGLILLISKPIYSVTGLAISSSIMAFDWLRLFGVGLLGVGIFLMMEREGVPSGTFHASLDLPKYRNYRLCAYPGPGVVDTGRAEHLPLHIHVESPNLPRELIIETETLRERNGLKIPKDLRKHLEANLSTIQKQADEMYRFGQFYK